jgi:thiamine biosynthesis protein ThiI
MREILLLKYGEIVLKGLNRPTFEAILVSNIKRRLKGLGRTVLTKSQSAMFIEPQDEDYDIDEAMSRIQKVFGLAAISRAIVIEKDMEKIKETAVSYLRETLEGASSFKVVAKRSDKKFAYDSPQICVDVGAHLLDAFPNLHVDVHNPEVSVVIEIRDFGAYVHGSPVPGAGGMPVGSNGRAAVLISGGIDSPVAAYMLAKRGVRLEAVHFASPPYTSERAKLKVLELLKIVSGYSGRIVCHVVPFTRIQEEIQKNCPEELFTIIMRRFMMKVASEIASNNACSALITGESIGQVASQTIEAISCTDVAAEQPALRPLIGMDKEEIVRISRKIGTFDTSIQPYEDCCTVFTPRHPRTRPKIEFVLEAEAKFDFEPLLKEAVENAERIVID